MFVERRQQFQKENAELFRPDTRLFEISTSIDSLAPNSPILPALFHARKAPWTRYHNIVGRADKGALFRRVAGDGDGIVEYESAHLDDAESEIVVPADHVNVHRHPLSVLEVRRILLQQLEELRRQPSYDDGAPRTAAAVMIREAPSAGRDLDHEALRKGPEPQAVPKPIEAH
jgi:hypothetical protein